MDVKAIVRYYYFNNQCIYLPSVIQSRIFEYMNEFVHCLTFKENGKL